MSITLLDIFQDLSYGELQQLGLGNFLAYEDESAPDPKDYAQLISHINLGLKELYKRFMLSSKEITVRQFDGVEFYLLSSYYAVSNNDSPASKKWIRDSDDEPFLDDIIKVEQVFDGVGDEMFLNDRNNELSLFTPTFRTLQIPFPLSYEDVTVQYRATHPKVVYTKDMDPASVELELPHGLHEALLFYIAHRAITPLNADQGRDGGVYWQKFIASCDLYAQEGIEMTSEYESSRFDDAGWV